MKTILCLATLLALCVVTSTASAQRLGRNSANNDPAALLEKLKPFDANQDGKITIAEVTDERLLPLFERADEDGNGEATFAELTALFAKETSAAGQGGYGGGRPMGPPPAGDAPMGPPMMRLGLVLPPPVTNQLELSAEQTQKLAELQKMVDERLKAILTERQMSQLQQMGPPQRGPGGPPPRN